MGTGDVMHGKYGRVYVGLGTLASAAAFYVSTGFGHIWPALWIAPIPILLVAFESTALVAALAAFLAYALGSLNLLEYLHVLPLPIPVVIAALAVPAIFFALAVLAARLAVLRLGSWVSVFAFAAAWTTYEWLSSEVSVNGTFGSFAYPQVGFLPLIQIASLTGLWGITFIMTLVPSGLAVAWRLRRGRGEAAAALAVAVGIGLATLAYGWTRLARPAPGPALRVGLASRDADMRYFDNTDSAPAISVAEDYARLTDALAGRGAQVVVLPEKLVTVTPEDSQQVSAILAEAARRNAVTLIAGINQAEPRPPRNIARVYAADGHEIIEYDKMHMLPGPETGYQVGTKPGLFELAAANVGVEICKDMDFPDSSRPYGKAGAGIVFAPAWDFRIDDTLHGHMAILRAVENGFALVRSAADGSLTVTDYHGCVIAELPTSRSHEVLLTSEVAAGPGRTFYSASGNWLGWVSIFVLIILIAASVRRKP